MPRNAPKPPVPRRGLRIFAQGNGGGGGRGTGQRFLAENRPTTKQPPQTPPSSGEIGLRLSPSRAVRLAPLLTARGRRPCAAAPPQPVTARQKTSAGPRRSPPPPALSYAAAVPDWLLGLRRWRLGEAIGLRPRQSKRQRKATPPPPTGASLQAVRPLRAREKPDLEEVNAAVREANPLPESVIAKSQ